MGTGRLSPALVVSPDAINRQPWKWEGTPPTLLAAIHELHVTARETALAKDTLFACFQLHSLDPARFLHPRTETPNLAGALPAARV